jgi:bacterioferritin-associated ferredoxin
MYVCLCRGVSERKVRSAISRGARTIEEVGAACGAGTRCGGCWPLIDDLLAEIDNRTRNGSNVTPISAARRTALTA